MARQCSVHLVPGRVEPSDARAVIGWTADEPLQRDRLLQPWKHRAEPDQFPLPTLAQRRPFHLKGKQPGADVPEPRRVEPRRDVSLQQVGYFEAAAFGLLPFPGLAVLVGSWGGKLAAIRRGSAIMFSLMMSSTNQRSASSAW